MSENTLYLLQSDYAATASILDQLAQIHTPDDSVVLMGESLLYVEHDFLQQLPRVYLLENDAQILVSPLPEHATLLNYAQFADLCLAFKRCISMK